MKATFERRGSPRPAEPIVFSSEYEHSEVVQARWMSFLKRTHLPDKGWGKTLAIIRDRLRPLYEALLK